MPRLKKLNTTSVIVRNAEGKFLGVSRKDNHYSWGFAGGKCEKDESFEDCAKRELLEETGLVAEEMKIIDIRPYTNRYKHPHTLDTVACYEVTKYSGELLSNEELIAKGEGILRWVGAAELIAGAFGNYNSAILQDYYGLKSIHLVEEHYDYEGSQVMAAFTEEKDAVEYCNKYAEYHNKRWGRDHYKKLGEGSYSCSGGSLDVNECFLDLEFYEVD